MTEDKILRSVGERGFNLERMILVREGRRKTNNGHNDSIFERNRDWMSKDTFWKAMDHYYAARGWDLETGIPRRQKLEELRLQDIADELEEKYRIPVPP